MVREDSLDWLNLCESHGHCKSPEPLEFMDADDSRAEHRLYLDPHNPPHQLFERRDFPIFIRLAT